MTDWKEYREGLEQKIIEAEFADNESDANFMADLLVLMAKNQHLGNSDGMDWKHMLKLVDKTIGLDGYMDTCGY